MAKRFIDTEIFNDEFFMNLSIEAKLFYIYLFVNCNHAGIIKLNKRLCEFQTGIKSLATVTKELDNRIVRVREDLFFLPKFIKFQYPNFPQSKVKQQDSALKILSELKIDYKSYLTLSEQLINCHEHDNDNEHDINNKHGKEKKEHIDVVQLFRKNWNRNYKNNSELQTAEQLVKEFGIKKVNKAFHIAGANCIERLNYVRGILNKEENEIKEEKTITEKMKERGLL